MLSFMLYQKKDLNLYTKAQKNSPDLWFCLHIVKYCLMKSTKLSCLLILGTKRYMVYYLLVFGGLKCENYGRGFVGRVRFVNMLKTVYRHP